MSTFELPNGIKHGDKLYKLISLDEIRGKHQNILVNPSPKTPLDHIEPLLTDLILDITNDESESLLPAVSKKDIILHKLSIQDIQFIMVRIREITYDKSYLMTFPCTHCEESNNAKLDLSELEIFPREDKIAADKMFTPKENLAFKYRHLSLANLKKGMFVEGKNNIMASIVTETSSYLLASLGENTKVTSKDLDELKAKDVDYIQDNYPKYAEIDLKVEHTCSECKKDFDQELPVLAADFLLRMRT